MLNYELKNQNYLINDQKRVGFNEEKLCENDGQEPIKSLNI